MKNDLFCRVTFLLLAASLCRCSALGPGSKKLTCRGVSDDKQKALAILSKGCEVADICTATMGEFVACWRKDKVTFETAKASLEASKHRQLEKFLQTYNEGDEVWHYLSPEETWEHHVGSEGYAIFRNGRLIGAIETRIR